MYRGDRWCPARAAGGAQPATDGDRADGAGLSKRPGSPPRMTTWPSEEALTRAERLDAADDSCGPLRRYVPRLRTGR